MNTNKQLYDHLRNVDFGDIDGLYDSNLHNYFIDYNYWDNIVEKDVFFVIGRKGTGKSAIYSWINSQQKNKGLLVSNLSFKQFPFEKLLQLSDDDFSKPNQYQSIWRNIILSEIAKIIILDQKNPIDENFKNLKNYVDFNFGTDIHDLHKQITTVAKKSADGLNFKGITHTCEKENTISYGDQFQNITKINRMLESCIISYLISHNTTKYIIQFDQLDDNYTSYTKNDTYFQAIISLFKTVYDLGQTFRNKKIPVKIVAYLRSDIYYSINNFDAESARWDQFKYHINWSIVNRTDWQNPKLLQLINARIENSIPEFKNKNAFQIIFNKYILNLKFGEKLQDIFKYIVTRSFHRPRDIIQFCKKIQEQAMINNTFDFNSIKNAEKEYSLWLLSELANELSPIINNLPILYEFLRLLGRYEYSLSDFRIKYNKYQHQIGIDAENLAKQLYNLGLLMNVNTSANRREYFSIIRNDRSVFNRDLMIKTHPGFYTGLYTTEYMRR